MWLRGLKCVTCVGPARDARAQSPRCMRSLRLLDGSGCCVRLHSSLRLEIGSWGTMPNGAARRTKPAREAVADTATGKANAGGAAARRLLGNCARPCPAISLGFQRYMMWSCVLL